jgi:MscS family membrane protein
MFKNKGGLADAMVDAVNATAVVDAPVVSARDAAAQEAHRALSDAIASTGNQALISLSNNPLLFFLALVVLAFAVSYIFVFLSKTVVKAFTARTKTDLDDKLLDRLQHPVAWSLFVLFLSVALVPLSLSNLLASGANLLLASINIFLVGTIINRILSVLIAHYGARIAAQTESAVDDHLLPIIKKILTVTIYIIAFFFVLGVWGVQVAPLLAGAGIAGLALAFALQESLKNIFGGVSLAFDRAYAAGDRIKLGDGTVGVVQEISLRSTKIRSFDGDLIVVPNGKIANENFQTYAQPTQETRVVIDFGVAYGSDLDKVNKVVMEAIKGIEHQFTDKERGMENAVFFVTMGAYSLDHKVIFWVDDYRESWNAKITATRRIYDALGKAKIEIPFPVQTVYLRK